MLKCQVRFHLKNLAKESLQPAGPEQFSEGAKDLLQWYYVAFLRLCKSIQLAVKTLICYEQEVTQA